MSVWRRTGRDEYPNDGQECMIYFKHTGYCISTFGWDNWVDGTGKIDIDMGKTPCFSDKGGYLGDEDVLWMPLDEAALYIDNPPALPDDYVNDRSFMKWDDPNKIYGYVEILEDFHYDRNPDNRPSINPLVVDVPKGIKLGVTMDPSIDHDYQCIFGEGDDMCIIYIPKILCKYIL